MTISCCASGPRPSACRLRPTCRRWFGRTCDSLAPLPDRELQALRSAVTELPAIGRNLNAIARIAMASGAAASGRVRSTCRARGVPGTRGESACFAALRDGFKRVDVPPNEFAERRRAVLDARERGRILQDNLAVFGPTGSGRSMSERAALTVQGGPAAAYANDRRIARNSVGLLASFDRRHDGARGDTAFLSPLCLPGNR